MSIFVVMAALCALISWSVAAWLQVRAEELDLVNVPNARSSHIHPTPNGGGLGIVVASSLAGATLILYSGWTLGWFVLGPALVLAAIGLRDDISHVSTRIRFGVQIAVCGAMLFALGDLPGISIYSGQVVELRGFVLKCLLLLAAVWWINLFNFMDGIDGIAGMQAIFMLLSAAGLAVYAHPEALYSPVWVWMVCISAATAGFLLLNWPPAKIFMGDVGSTWLAFVVFALALPSIQAGWLSYTSWLVLSALFMTDATVTLVTRMLRGERWYQAHRSHAYQRLSRKWQDNRKAGHRAVTLLFLGVNVLWLAPLATATLLLPTYNWLWLMLAYSPLVVCTLRLGAGRPDSA